MEILISLMWQSSHNVFSSVQLLSRVRLFVTPWTAAHQASLSITNSRSSPRLTSIDSMMPSSHLILCRPLLLPPSIFPSIRVFSNESALPIRWPKYWSFSFSICISKHHIVLLNIYNFNLSVIKLGKRNNLQHHQNADLLLSIN